LKQEKQKQSEESDQMAKIPKVQRTKDYCRIAGQLSDYPFIKVNSLAKKVRLHRNTVSRYMKKMYSHRKLIGPWMSLKPHTNYIEYVYLLNSTDPLSVYEELKEFSHIMYHAVTFGHWNTIAITSQLIDFSQLTGFQSVVYQGVKEYVYTPEIEYSTWDYSLKRMHRKLSQFTPFTPEYPNGNVTSMNWGNDQWELYHAFKSNMRQRIMPVLRKIDVRYETFAEWKKTLKNHCTIHAEFYPQGVSTYANYCFLISTEYPHIVKSVFSMLPTTPVVIGTGDHVLVFVKTSSAATEEMISVIRGMKKRRMINQVTHAIVEHDYR